MRFRHAWFVFVAGAAVAALLAPVALSAAVFNVAPGPPNLVKFDSKATAESFSGTTGQVNGTINFDPESLADSVQVAMTVDLASLDTGIAIRNKHMREDHLQTDQYPTATFHGGRIRNALDHSLAGGKTVRFDLDGEFQIHGVTRRITVPMEATLTGETPGKRTVHVVGHFPVTLADYNISRPRFLMLRLGETQQVTIDLQGVEQP